MKLALAFVGAGKMVTAIVEGLLAKDIFKPEEMACVSAPDGTSEKLATATGINRTETLAALLAERPDRLLLGCKPQQLDQLDPSALQQVEGSLVLSIMAGKTLESLQGKFPTARNIVRSMPNTPGQIGAGAPGYLFAQTPAEDDRVDVERILSALGKVFPVEEEAHIDCVTAISGSGPAYLFEFACALEEAGANIGLDKEVAKELAIETILGAGRLMARSEHHPETLRNHVTSPNGTTQAALEAFAEGDFRNLVGRAVQAARDRSVELSDA